MSLAQSQFQQLSSSHTFVQVKDMKSFDLSVVSVGPPSPPVEEDIALDLSKLPKAHIDDRKAKEESDLIVAVIGVGYVGKQLVEAFSQHYHVLAFDVSEHRLRAVEKDLGSFNITFTSNPSDLRKAGCFLISVPTILNHDKTIDTNYLQKATETVSKYAQPGATVVMESSVAIGMTRQLLKPLVDSKNLKVGMSPERVDPGRTFPLFEDIPKVISGIDAESLSSIRDIYSRVFKNIVPVSSCETAEMTKLYENCQRMVCAAYANEMSDACTNLGINAWEVSEAAASKPFGYQPYRPGPGIGGHCIPVNPYYLLSTCEMPILQHATETSWKRPASLAKRLMDDLESKKTGSAALSQHERKRVLVVGVGFKKGQDVLSNSPGVNMIVALMSDYDVYVEFADPLVSADPLSYVPKMDTDKDWNTEYLNCFDGIIVAVNQTGLDMDILNHLAGPVVHDYCPTN